MEHIKISLVDNDYVVHAKTDIEVNGHNDPVKKFLRQIREELIPGQTAHLEIEGPEKEMSTYEISVVD